MEEIETYLQQFPANVQKILQNIRKLITKNAPTAAELFSYGMPGYKLNNKPLVYFAAYKNHIGFYATPSGHKEFKYELAKYKQGKGSVQFPLNKPIPYRLIEQIVRFRVVEIKNTLRTCTRGHKYYKSSDGINCPTCEVEKKQIAVFPASLSLPARRALHNNGIKTLKQLSKYSENELLQLHGLGKSSIIKLQKALQVKGLKLKN